MSYENRFLNFWKNEVFVDCEGMKLSLPRIFSKAECSSLVRVSGMYTEMFTIKSPYP